MYTFKTNRKCPRCGKELRTTDVEGYAFVCHECDENFLEIEVKDQKKTIIIIPNFTVKTKVIKEAVKKNILKISIDDSKVASISEINIPLDQLADLLKGCFRLELDGIQNSDTEILKYAISSDYYNSYQCLKENYSDDLGRALENTLCMILDNGGSSEDVKRIIGAELRDPTEDEFIHDEFIYIGLGYIIPGIMINTWS